MNKRIIIVGPGASGKDYLRKKLESKGYTNCIRYTTRPIRKGEIPGKDYIFISLEDFKNKIDSNYFINYEVFKEDWYYGTSAEDFKKSDLIILNPLSIKSLTEKDRKASLIFYIDCPKEIRYSRLLTRNDSDDALRRIEYDEKDFSDFSDYDIKINNFSINEFN